MNIVALLNLTSLIFMTSSFFIIWFKKRIKLSVPLLSTLTCLVCLAIFVSLSNLLEWAGITKSLDLIEDYWAILEPTLWLFFFYFYFQETVKDEIEKTKNEYKFLVENQNDMIVKTNAKGEILFASPNYCRAFNQSEKKLIGKLFNPLFCEDRIKGENELSILKHPPHRASIELQSLTKKGMHWFSWSNSAVVNRSHTITAIICVGRDITEKKNAEQTIIHALSEKDTLLKEVHHRVKNNLLILYGLIELQQDTLTENQEHVALLEVVKRRIQAIGKVHQMLYQSKNLSEISLSEYIRSITSEIVNTYSSKDLSIETEIDISPININLDTAVPCSLIINEILTNCFKHAFTGKRSGKISVSLHKKDNKTELTIQDNGIGMSDELIEQFPKSLGLTLVTMLTKQIGGELFYEQKNGSLFRIIF